MRAVHIDLVCRRKVIERDCGVLKFGILRNSMAQIHVRTRGCTLPNFSSGVKFIVDSIFRYHLSTFWVSFALRQVLRVVAAFLVDPWEPTADLPRINPYD